MIANDIITRAFRLLNVTASGETATADQSQDALQCLNALIADWSGGQTLTQFATPQYSFLAPTSRTSFTIGPTGDVVTVRPISLDNLFLRAGGMDYPVTPIGEAEYKDITLKSQLGGYSQVAWYDATLTNGTVYLWPGISAAQTLFFDANQPMDVFTSLFDSVDLPPNYQRALAYNLALDIADDYEIEPSRNVFRIAAASKRSIKRTNVEVPKMSNEAAYLSSQSCRINIITGR